MIKTQNSKQVLIILGPLFQDEEVIYPYYRLQEGGYKVVVAGLGRWYQGFPGEKVYKGKLGLTIVCQGEVKDYNPKDFLGVHIPGGWAPDKIRQSPEALKFIKEIDRANKVIGATCHAGWALISAGIMKGHKVALYPGIKDDIANAGGRFVNRSVLVDKNWVTSRVPADMPDYGRELVRALDKLTK